MSNQIDHRRPANKRNDWHPELPFSSGCSGEGHNGQIGRSKWKKISRRVERRAFNNGGVPRVKKLKKRLIVQDGEFKRAITGAKKVFYEKISDLAE